MIVLTLILSSLLIFLTSLYWYQRRSRYASLLNKFPELVPYVPVLGHVTHFSLKRDVQFKQVRKYMSRFKETVSAWGGIYGSVHILSAEDAEIILSSTKYIGKGMLYEFFSSWLGTGLLTSTGAKWHQRRKMLTPAFHYNILQMFIDIFGENGSRLTKRLKGEIDKPKTNIVPFITQTTLETICETSMGINLENDDETQKKYHEALHSLADCIITRVFSPWLHSDIAFFFTPTYWKQRKLVKLMHNFTNAIIQKRIATFKDSDITNLEINDGRLKKRLAMLDLLIYANKHLGTIDYEGIREEVDTFVFEGHDTTAIALCCILILLANNPDVQEKIIAELDEIFGDSDRHATYDDLQNMKYLECCLKEGMRLHPSVPLIIRKSLDDIPLTKHTVPGDTEIFVHIYEIHRNPKYFPDPEKFDPDRFLPENVKGRHPYAYIPFSAGPRNCIGQKFAMLELKSIVSSIFRSFTLEAVDAPKDLNWVIDLVLRINGPVNIKFKPRYQNTNEK